MKINPTVFQQQIEKAHRLTLKEAVRQLTVEPTLFLSDKLDKAATDMHFAINMALVSGGICECAATDMHVRVHDVLYIRDHPVQYGVRSDDHVLAIRAAFFRSLAALKCPCQTTELQPA